MKMCFIEAAVPLMVPATLFHELPMPQPPFDWAAQRLHSLYTPANVLEAAPEQSALAYVVILLKRTCRLIGLPYTSEYTGGGAAAALPPVQVAACSSSHPFDPGRCWHADASAVAPTMPEAILPFVASHGTHDDIVALPQCPIGHVVRVYVVHIEFT